MDFKIRTEPTRPDGPISGREAAEYGAGRISGPIWVDTLLDGGWLLSLRFVLDSEEAWTVAELRVRPYDTRYDSERTLDEPAVVPDNGITSDLVRTIRLGALTRAVSAALSDPFDEAWPVSPADPIFGMEWEETMKGSGYDLNQVKDAKPRGPGRPAIPDIDLARTAVLYHEAVRAEIPNPIQTVADQLGRRPETVRQWVHKARRRGFLTAAPANRQPGGAATPKAREVLEASQVETERTDPTKEQAQ